jgi:outer membrane protein TolC
MLHFKRFFHCFFIYILFLFCAIPVFANPSSDEYLETCLRVAQQKNTNLVVARRQVELSESRVKRSLRNFFPGVTGERKWSRGKALGAGTTVQVGADVTYDEYQAEQLGLRVTQPIYVGGQLTATYRYDKLMQEASKYNYAMLREELFYNVKLSYYEYLSLKMEYGALRKAFSQVNDLLKKITDEYHAKAISELDLKEAEIFSDKVGNLLMSARSNLLIAEKKLCTTIGVDAIEDLPGLVPEGLYEELPDISFKLDDCKYFIKSNNLDLKISKLQIEMANQKKVIATSKELPKISLDWFWGLSGEAFTGQPLALPTIYTLMTKFSWSFLGNSMDVVETEEKLSPTEIVDVNNREETSGYDAKISLLDVMDNSIERSEAKVGQAQALNDHKDTEKKIYLRLEKAYTEYDNSLRNARTTKNEVQFLERKLEFLRKRNLLYEVTTVSVMEETWKYAETITEYAKALYTNFYMVTELERLTMTPMR